MHQWTEQDLAERARIIGRETVNTMGFLASIGQDITAEQLARLLEQYDQDYRAQQRPEGWPDYYTAQLLGWRNTAGDKTSP